MADHSSLLPPGVVEGLNVLMDRLSCKPPRSERWAEQLGSQGGPGSVCTVAVGGAAAVAMGCTCKHVHVSTTAADQ